MGRLDLRMQMRTAKKLSQQARVDHNPLERIKMVSTREGTLANLLRQLITEEDLGSDIEAITSSLVERCTSHGKKPSLSQVKNVLTQLKKEAGV